MTPRDGAFFAFGLMAAAAACVALVPTKPAPASVPAVTGVSELTTAAVGEARRVSEADAARWARGAAYDLGYRVVGLHCSDAEDGVSARCLLRLKDEAGSEEIVSWACGPGGRCWAVAAP